MEFKILFMKNNIVWWSLYQPDYKIIKILAIY